MMKGAFKPPKMKWKPKSLGECHITSKKTMKRVVQEYIKLHLDTNIQWNNEYEETYGHHYNFTFYQ